MSNWFVGLLMLVLSGSVYDPAQQKFRWLVDPATE
jgi:hypothetical protein